MKISTPKFLAAAFLASVCQISFAETVTVTTTEAGTLANLIDATTKATTTSLKVNGPLNGADILFLRQMMTAGLKSSETYEGVLAELDLSDATIVASDDHYYETSKVGYTTANNEVGDYMFNKCVTLTSIKLPRTATRIGQNAFLRLENLTSIVLPEALVTIDKSAFAYSNAFTELAFPATLDSIMTYAFQSATALKTISFAEGASLRYVSESAFNYCTALESAELPATVEYIGASAFSGDTTLTSFTFPASLKEVGNNAFQGCSHLSQVSEIPAGVTSFGYGVFQSAPLSEIKVNSANTNYVVENNVLFNAGKTALIYMPMNCGKTSYHVPSTVTEILNFALYKVSTLKELILNDGLTTIQNTAFSQTGLETIVIPSSVTTISSYMLEGCPSLTGVTILGTISDVPANAFRESANMTRIAFAQATPPTFVRNSFYGNPETIYVYVPAESIPAYETAMAPANRSSYIFCDINTSDIQLPKAESQMPNACLYDLLGRPIQSNAKGIIINAGRPVINK